MSRIRSVHPDEWPITTRGLWRHIYVIQEGEDGPVKVGIAANAFLRRNGLQVGNHRRLFVRAVFHVDCRDAAWNLERRVHGELKDRSIGGEWFECAPDAVVAIIEGAV